MDKDVLEMFSETLTGDASKPKGGRPAVMPLATEKIWEVNGMFCEAKTRRGRLNYHYIMEALAALGDRDSRDGTVEPRFRWLFDMSKKVYRRTILGELGRIGDRDDIRAVAAHLCDEKPPTSKAVATIRRCRGLGQESGDARQLASRLIATINRYLDRYPELSPEGVLHAIDVARYVIEKQDQERAEAGQATSEGDGGEVETVTST